MLNQKPLWNETLLLKNLDQNNPKRKIEKRFLIKKKKNLDMCTLKIRRGNETH